MKGYHLEHNFGHGKQHLSALLAAMNILAFLVAIRPKAGASHASEARQFFVVSIAHGGSIRRSARQETRQTMGSNAVINRIILFLSLSVLWASAQPMRTEEQTLPRPSSPPHARVVIVEDPHSIIAFSPVGEVVEEMVNRGVTAVTAKPNPGVAWRSLVSTQDTVGIKVFSSPGATSGTRPAVVAAVVKGLIAAGLPPKQIVIWDKSLADLRLAGFGDLAEQFGVSLAGSADEGYDEKYFYETALLGKLVWGDLEFGKKGDELGRKSFVSKLLTRRVTKIINIAPLLNHNLAQVSGILYSLMRDRALSY